MSVAQTKLQEQVERLRKQLATVEATAETLRGKIAEIEAKLNKTAPPVTGLDLLWKAALPISRNRSTKQQCRIEWNKIPKGERPTIEELVAALKIWNRSSEWKKDGHTFVPGLHRWIKNRAWEDLPEVEDAPSRYRNTPKPAPQADPSEAVTDAAEIAALLGIKPLRMNS